MITEKIIKEKEIRIQAFEEAIEAVKKYDKEMAIAYLEGKIDGCKITIEALSDGKRDIL